MKVKELMERIDIEETGRAIAYIKDGLDEISMLVGSHITTERLNIDEDKRFYHLPGDMLRIIDVRVKNHLNSKDEYRSIPRTLHKPPTADADGK